LWVSRRVHFSPRGKSPPTELRRPLDRAARQLAESLGGALLSAARRGHLDEETLERLLDVSTHLDEVEELLGDLIAALPALAEKGDDRDVARLAAVAFGVSLQLVLHADDEDPKALHPVRAG
jgi:hypothetical protein